MKVYWVYTCDYSHTWRLFRDEDALERPEDTRCPMGHEAVILLKERPLDEVQVTLRPAARIVDDVKHQVIEARKYWLVLTDIEDSTERASARTYTWREVLVLAERFHGRSQEMAWKLWDKLQP